MASLIKFRSKNVINKSHNKLRGPSTPPILIDGASVEQVESFKFLGVHITNKLTWSKHTRTVVKWARQNRFPPQETAKIWHGSSIESILTGCITAWYGNCSASDRKALQRVVRMDQYITGAKLPAIQDLYTRWCQPLIRHCYSLFIIYAYSL